MHAVQKQQSKPVGRNCYRCGGKHATDTCCFKDTECHFCHKKGHIAKVCHTKLQVQGDMHAGAAGSRHHRQNAACRGTNRNSSSQHNLQAEELEEGVADSTYNMFAVTGESSKTEPMKVTVQASGANLEMEVDTGAASSVISDATFQQLWPKGQGPPLYPTGKRLCTYTREPLKVRGATTVSVHYQGQTAELELVVVAGAGPSLLGRDWLQKIRLDWQSLNQIRPAENLQHLLKRHAEIFSDELGLVAAAPAKIHVDPSAQPRFCKARTVPYALKEKVERELEQLESTGIISPVQFSDWAAPIVPVVKTDGTIRVCGDYI